jgi:putative Holliday junction resolvase
MKVIGLDFGSKRTGIAITDELRMIASPLETVDTSEILNYLEKLFLREKVEVIVLGEAKYLNGQSSETTVLQQKFADKLGKKFPEKKIVRVNEMFTSSLAEYALREGGFKKSERSQKGNVDKVSAALILRSYLESPGNK